ncbi:MAG: TIGR04282 family arsenosugar biosynthesis glycosyltransferase [Vicinamibacterales bacterium]|nr:TIGR04282 family arsenosugar biosynthesis glycosyltransferase [Vicinamibacterales bacterium]
MTESGPLSIIVLARAPDAPGKTRVTASLTAPQATALRTALLTDTLAAAAASGVPVDVCYTPAAAGGTLAALAGEVLAAPVRLRPQGEGDLGARMRQAFDEAFAAGQEHVVLVGSDLPTLPPFHLTDAIAALTSPADVVLGPSDDGGYYLVGVSRSRADVALGALFTGIPWGAPDVLARTLERLREAGVRVELVAPWFDVDTPEDLARVAADPRAEAAPRTRMWLAAAAVERQASPRQPA